MRNNAIPPLIPAVGCYVAATHHFLPQIPLLLTIYRIITILNFIALQFLP
jgi:hypothetical protein